MRLPESIQEKLNSLFEKHSLNLLAKAREGMTKTYLDRKSSASVFKDPASLLAYLGARLPATYGAVCWVLEDLLKKVPDFQCERFLDLGAGPGTASMAAKEIFADLKEIFLLEQSKEVIAIGKQLIGGHWEESDLSKRRDFPVADLAIFSYSWGEIKDKEKLFDALWNSPIPYFIWIEPGTPAGYRQILDLRRKILEKKGFLIAPCPHADLCPLKNGWCHFKQRIERTSLHKKLKTGELGYEDEKFSYLIGAKYPHPTKNSRILQDPKKQKGFLQFFLCTPEGKAKECIVLERNKERYKEAKHFSWGDEKYFEF